MVGFVAQGIVTIAQNVLPGRRTNRNRSRELQAALDARNTKEANDALIASAFESLSLLSPKEFADLCGGTTNARYLYPHYTYNRMLDHALEGRTWRDKADKADKLPAVPEEAAMFNSVLTAFVNAKWGTTFCIRQGRVKIYKPLEDEETQRAQEQKTLPEGTLDSTTLYRLLGEMVTWDADSMLCHDWYWDYSPQLQEGMTISDEAVEMFLALALADAAPVIRARIEAEAKISVAVCLLIIEAKLDMQRPLKRPVFPELLESQRPETEPQVACSGRKRADSFLDRPAVEAWNADQERCSGYEAEYTAAVYRALEGLQQRLEAINRLLTLREYLAIYRQEIDKQMAEKPWACQQPRDEADDGTDNDNDSDQWVLDSSQDDQDEGSQDEQDAAPLRSRRGFRGSDFLRPIPAAASAMGLTFDDLDIALYAPVWTEPTFPFVETGSALFTDIELEDFVALAAAAATADSVSTSEEDQVTQIVKIGMSIVYRPVNRGPCPASPTAPPKEKALGEIDMSSGNNGINISREAGTQQDSFSCNQDETRKRITATLVKIIIGMERLKRMSGLTPSKFIAKLPRAKRMTTAYTVASRNWRRSVRKASKPLARPGERIVFRYDSGKFNGYKRVRTPVNYFETWYEQPGCILGQRPGQPPASLVPCRRKTEDPDVITTAGYCTVKTLLTAWKYFESVLHSAALRDDIRRLIAETQPGFQAWHGEMRAYERAFDFTKAACQWSDPTAVQQVSTYLGKGRWHCAPVTTLDRFLAVRTHRPSAGSRWTLTDGTALIMEFLTLRIPFVNTMSVMLRLLEQRLRPFVEQTMVPGWPPKAPACFQGILPPPEKPEHQLYSYMYVLPLYKHLCSRLFWWMMQSSRVRLGEEDIKQIHCWAFEVAELSKNREKAVVKPQLNIRDRSGRSIAHWEPWHHCGPGMLRCWFSHWFEHVVCRSLEAYEQDEQVCNAKRDLLRHNLNKEITDWLLDFQGWGIDDGDGWPYTAEQMLLNKIVAGNSRPKSGSRPASVLPKPVSTPVPFERHKDTARE
ncbi:hypothetical protein BD289DRAFT_485449 [Coniella lustricola]|uniref:Uncharacterized protein n=1 Tax=Coniella lustricola TaxID=2025994 RepID=A0A2T2ZYN7_9PEZI|nr:hypothetical protein BD289DRAFT_485449 [Coniella lustricola]